MNNSAAYAQDELLDRQRSAWESGERPCPEEFLLDHWSADRQSELMDLIYNEMVIREELGDIPELAEYVGRYPHLADELKIQFEVHSALRGNQASTLPFSASMADSHRPPSLASIPDTALKGYEILSTLGEGGMGTVYKARDRSLNRLVALKMIQKGRIPSERELRRFRTEAEAIARLGHPNIVRIHEVGEIDGTPYLSLELAEGGTLAAKLREFPFVPRAAAELIRVLALALQHAHDHRIIHRDLKPANILFGADGQPRIADFGLAKIIEERESNRDTTRTGEPLGTPRYMSPEQAAGKMGSVGVPADVHALGLLLYECLTGQVPFVGSNAMQTMERIRNDEPLPPRRLQAAIPRDLETICLHCLHKQPERRYPSAQSVADDLGRFLRGESIMARPTPAWEKAWKWCRRNPTTSSAIAAGLLLAVGVLGYFYNRQSREDRRIAGLRSDVLFKLDVGFEALAYHDPRKARNLFQEAWKQVGTEPALADLSTTVSGWLDHARREEERGTWDKQAGPRTYADLRDEAFLLVLLNEKEDRVGRDEGFKHTRSLMPENDSSWNFERELVAVFEAEALLAGGEAQSALDVLDGISQPRTGIWHRKRADCFERLDRQADAQSERRTAEPLPPLPAWDAIDRGMVLYHRGAFADAERLFGEVLVSDPAEFPARLFQAVCLLKMNRLDEAKIGLTACLAQRSAFAWSYLLRGDMSRTDGNPNAAKADYEKAMTMKVSESLRRHLSERVKPMDNPPDNRRTEGDRK